MIKAIKTFFDASDFDEIGDSMDLWWNTIQNSFGFDALKSKTKFLAVVLTPPLPLEGVHLSNFLGITDAGSSDQDSLPKFTFKARILGDLSPHRFWPDPCDPRFVEDAGGQQEAMEWILKHTDVVAIGADNVVSVGDMVRIELSLNVFTVSPESAVLVEILQNLNSITDVKLRKAASKECAEPLSSFFENFTPPDDDDGKDLTLQEAYKALYKELAPPPTTAQAIYDFLYIAFGSNPSYNNLIIGMLANIEAESAGTFNPGIISGASGESSVGLFQMNVGRAPSVGSPRTVMTGQMRLNGVDDALIIDKKDPVIPYFAGSLFLERKGYQVITPDIFTDVFSGDKDQLKLGYNALIAKNGEAQLDFVASEVKKLLTTLKVTDPSSYSSQDWSFWFQIYFEQPANVKLRALSATIKTK